MKERLAQLLREHELSLQRKREQIEAFEDDPLSFFDGLQEDSHIVFESLHRMDEGFWRDYQAWQYPLVQQQLLLTYVIRPFEIRWNEDVFPSPLYFLYDGYPSCAILPYERTFYILPSESLADLLIEYKRLKIQAIELWESYNMERLRMRNPFVDQEDTLTNNVKFLFKQKKIEGQHQQNMNELNSAYKQLEIDVQRIEIQIQTVMKEEDTLQYEMDKLYTRLSRPLTLKFRNGQQEAVDEIYEEIQELEELSRVRVDTMEKRSMDE